MKLSVELAVVKDPTSWFHHLKISRGTVNVWICVLAATNTPWGAWINTTLDEQVAH
jgi:hypothetical protein